MARTSNPLVYDEQSVYNKHQGGCDCDTKDECTCGCPPVAICAPGLVAVFDCNNNHVSCLTPMDAEIFNNSQIEAPDGFVKLYDPVTCKYIGNVTPESYSTIVAQLSADIEPVDTGLVDEGFNIVTGAVNIVNSELTAFSEVIATEVDRLSLSAPIVIRMSVTNPPPTGVTLNGSPVVMDEGESTKSLTVDVDNTVTANTYNFEIEFVSGTFVKVLPVTLTLS